MGLETASYYPLLVFLGAFAKLRKATIRIFMSVCPSIRPSVRMKQLGSLSTDFRENLICDNFSKHYRENSIYIKIGKFFFRKSCSLWDNVGKYCRAGQATDDNMAHAHCMLDT